MRNKWIEGPIAQAEKEKLFGKLELNFKEGTVVVINKTQSIKKGDTKFTQTEVINKI